MKYKVWATEKLYYLTTEIEAESEQEARDKYAEMLEAGNVEVNDSDPIQYESEII